MEIIYFAYFGLLICLLLYTSITEKEFFLFSHYPMYSDYYGENEYPVVYQIEVETMDGQYIQCQPSKRFYSKKFGGLFFKVMKPFLKAKTLKNSSREEANLYINAILSAVLPQQAKAIYIIEKSLKKRGKRLEKNSRTLLKISIQQHQKVTTWKVASLAGQRSTQLTYSL